MRYDKLIRDSIPEIIVRRGGTPVFHVATDEEYWRKLKEKLLEEFAEFSESETLEEMADLQEVLDAICEHKGFSRADVAQAQRRKSEERGAFRKRLILDES